MESIQQSMMDMSEMFQKKMADFHQQLQNSTSSSTDPAPQLISEFHAFRTFVLSSLQCLQNQVASLSKLLDQQEMRNRRNILLLHGITEEGNENTIDCVVKVITEKVKVTDFSSASLKRCHRLGALKGDKPRPILIKLYESNMKEVIWSAKSNLRGSGITLSEFLTNERHKVFMAARNRYGVNKCWTSNGRIFAVIDGSRRRIECLSDLEATSDNIPAPPNNNTNAQKYPQRSRRPTKAK
ncbi:unnamed protein product [Colias eurytheme]|nr:unnamed protein product [Colias eurytheme]CAG4940541.1 unnamed protein product [Colias eurytheme]